MNYDALLKDLSDYCVERQIQGKCAYDLCNICPVDDAICMIENDAKEQDKT